MEPDMQHQKLEQIKAVAAVDLSPVVLTRAERIERWAELLEREPARRITTLHGTEWQPVAKRAAMRCDDSALTVAFADPVLKAAGLKNDSYGEGKRFFEISDWELHEVVCDCHMGGTMSAEHVAGRVRGVLTQKNGGLFGRLRDALGG